MEKLVVTAAQPFTDIDALACAIVYSELLTKEGKKSIAVLPGPLNKSVTQGIKKWQLAFVAKPAFKEAKYILVDISDPEYFADFVDEKNVIEIFDHRVGFEDYWQKRLGTKSKIDMVGSCATLIWEEFTKRIVPVDISSTSANLLYTAIVSNTLNFKAAVTTQRDVSAFHEIGKFTDLPKNWIERYFSDQDKATLAKPKSSLLNDTKGIGTTRGDIVIGQLELWNSKEFFAKHLAIAKETLKGFGKPLWFLTSPSISEGVNYLYAESGEIKKLLTETIAAKFEGNIGQTKKLWLRKEILKKLQSLN